MQKTPHRVSVGLSPSEYEALQRIAERHHVSLAWIGRQAIVELLAQYQNSDSTILLSVREYKDDNE